MEKQKNSTYGHVAEIQQYVDALYDLKKFPTDLEPEVVTEIKLDLLDRLDSFINASIVEALPQNSMKAFQQLLDQNDPDAVWRFVEDQIPNLQQFLGEVLSDFGKIYLSEE